MLASMITIRAGILSLGVRRSCSANVKRGQASAVALLFEFTEIASMQ
jgi:hypothetical protein